VGRVAVAIACLVIGLVAVVTYFSVVADDPCNYQHRSSPAVALFIGAVGFGVAAYFLAERWTSRRWHLMMVLAATSVGACFALVTIALLVFWIPQCAN
jgi:hypothetical protein